MLTNREICSTLEAAFPPYRCVSEIWDYGEKVRFKVFDADDQPIITMAEVVLSSVRDVAALDSLCQQIRHRVQERADESKESP